MPCAIVAYLWTAIPLRIPARAAILCSIYARSIPIFRLRFRASMFVVRRCVFRHVYLRGECFDVGGGDDFDSAIGSMCGATGLSTKNKSAGTAKDPRLSERNATEQSRQGRRSHGMRTRTEHGQFTDNEANCYLSRYNGCLKTQGNFGEPCWIRTSDPLLKRQMLYRLS